MARDLIGVCACVCGRGGSITCTDADHQGAVGSVILASLARDPPKLGVSDRQYYSTLFPRSIVGLQCRRNRKIMSAALLVAAGLRCKSNFKLT